MAINDNTNPVIDDAAGDAEKGAALGGLGGIAAGALAGSLAGPIGAVVGAVAGGLIGAGASGAAVAAVDSLENPNTVPAGTTTVPGATLPAGTDLDTPYSTGTVPTTHTPTTVLPTTAGVMPVSTTDSTVPLNSYDSSLVDNVNMSSDAPVTGADTIGGHNIVSGSTATTEDGNTGLAAGAIVGGLIGTAVGGPIGAVIGGTVGSLAGGVAGDAVEASEDANVVDEGARTYAATTPTAGETTPSPIIHTGPTNPSNI